jgi:hypothetical protein
VRSIRARSAERSQQVAGLAANNAQVSPAERDELAALLSAAEPPASRGVTSDSDPAVESRTALALRLATLLGLILLVTANPVRADGLLVPAISSVQMTTDDPSK